MFSFLVRVHKDGTHVGTIQFHGVKRVNPDGSMRLPVRFGEHGTEEVPCQWALNPDDFVSEKVVKQIGSRLQMGQIVGETYDEGEYKWEADQP